MGGWSMISVKYKRGRKRCTVTFNRIKVPGRLARFFNLGLRFETVQLHTWNYGKMWFGNDDLLHDYESCHLRKLCDSVYEWCPGASSAVRS